LLCNYFNFIDKKENRNSIENYLLVGKAFPYGKVIFVLRRDRETNAVEIWDPFRGECYYMPPKEYDVTCFCIKT
jgi:hypothetical protein